MKNIALILALLPLAACGNGLLRGVPDDTAFGAPDPVAEGEDALVAETANTTIDETADARFLGFTVASLGDATMPGLWIETPLVDEVTPGRVVAESGLVSTVTLRPSGGDRNAGSQMSLAAFQALQIPLVALPTVTVLAEEQPV